MAFMQPQVYETDYYAVLADHGSTWIVPCDVAGNVATNADLQDYVEGTIDDPDEAPERLHGFVARLSAPGYLDCTDWSAFPTEHEARDYLRDMYGDDDDEADSDA